MSDKYNNNFIIFFIQIFTTIIFTLPIGVIDNKIQNYRDKNININFYKRIQLLFLESIILIIYIYILIHIFPLFTSTFQSSIPGMFFPGFVFALQYNMFVEFQNIIKKTNILLLN